MSLAADPKATYSHVLFSDRELAQDKQPVFSFRYLTSRQCKELDKSREEFDKAKIGEEVVMAAVKVLIKTLTGWKNVKDGDNNIIEFDIAKIEDVASPAELAELVMMAVSQRPTPEDKKKLESPSPSGSDNSAKTAPA
jgi:hypothetical protein